ncbi:DUF4962 domain-containing protein [Microlunatus sp. Y2014]|uniref:DUF4962 domain-containing protein n=1 Tax=Microlunatus sp. Y2014 TaxID=3418488 RepID=UPI003DA761D1
MTHPHLDPRQPRHDESPGTNPPLLAWLPEPDQTQFRLVVSPNPDLTSPVLDVTTTVPMFLPEHALTPGRYHWSWSAGDRQAETFTFDLTDDVVVLEVPPAAAWLSRMSPSHPRIHVRTEELPQLRDRFADSPHREQVIALADAALAEPHHLDEPPFLPDREVDGDEVWFAAWRKGVYDTQGFARGAQHLALAHLFTEDRRYARAACERMDSLARWDPEGSTEVHANSENHMATIWHTAKVTDWVWHEFTDEERARVVDHYAHRCLLQFRQLAEEDVYGVTNFDSHSGRKIVFLALWAIVLADEVPAAREWLDWLRPVLAGIWPVWAGDDGAWAEGVSYAAAYVEIMSMLATTLKHQADVDLYRRPFWAGHGQWRRWAFPPYAEWMGFGDGTDAAKSRNSNAHLVELIARETGDGSLVPYLQQVREQVHLERGGTEDPSAEQVLVSLITDLPKPTAPTDEVVRHFPFAGWAAIRSHVAGPAADDVAVLFRSSPLGSWSHSHADNNDVVLHVAGRVMLMPSGYYDGYATDHHAHWVWHTKAHNCVTLSDGGQLMRSRTSTGSIAKPYVDDNLVHLLGVADASYPQADRCRRHVVTFRESGVVLLLDDMVPLAESAVALQHNLHSYAEFEVDDTARRFTLQRGPATVVGQVMWHHTGFFEQSAGWFPEPLPERRGDQQHHLRFSTPLGPRALGVLLATGTADRAPATITAEQADGREWARFGSVEVSTPIVPGDELARITVDGQAYIVTPDGLHRG